MSEKKYVENIWPSHYFPYGDNWEYFRNNVMTIEIPSGYQADFEFTFNGPHEQMVCIYSGQTNYKVTERGNYSRDHVSIWSRANFSQQSISYTITGWYKDSGPDSKKAWNIPFMKVNYEFDQTIILFGDDLKADGKDKDIEVKISLNKN